MFARLVLSGGSIKGVAFAGCLRYLEHVNAIGDIVEFVGTSAGALTCLMAAAGFEADAIVTWFERQFRELALSEIEIENVLDVFETYGIDSGERLLLLAQRVLQHRGMPAEATFVEFAKHTGKNLVVCATNLTSCRHEFFGVDTSPEMPVALAVRMSMSIPIVFKPVRYKDCVYVDGSLLNNIPVDSVPRRGDPTRHTLAILITEGVRKKASFADLSDFVLHMLLLLVARMSAVSVDPYQDKVELLELDLKEFNIPWMGLDVENMSIPWDGDKMRRMVEYGYQQLKSKLQSKNIQL